VSHAACPAEVGGGQQQKRAGCLAKQCRLHPQAIRFRQKIPL